MASQSEIRQQVRSVRHALSEKQQKSEAIAERIIHSALFKRSVHIAVYLNHDGEVSTEQIIQQIWRADKHCYLPVLREKPQKGLWFSVYRKDSRLVANKFGIYEPAIHSGAIRHPWHLDLALVPLVAFDLSGNRIGRGGGYYDRTFAYMKQPTQPKAPLLVGLAFECQKQNSLPAHSWDIPLDAVVTEKAFYLFSAVTG